MPRGHGLRTDDSWDRAVRGFAARLTRSQIWRLQHDNRVVVVEPDVTVTIAEHGARRVHLQAFTSTAVETTPTGINRIDAELNPRTDCSAIGVAVIDTGVDLTHPDLNVAGNVTFVKGTRNGNDDNGHGSHVAGIVAAKTGDSRGVRGVAPNARLYAVKVLSKSGSGSLSQVLSGVNWVTQNAKSRGIKVANMSLGFQGTSSTLNTAIANSIAAGVTYVVAAGNSGSDAGGFSPANCPNVITVSAIVDTDGACGAFGPASGYGPDDSFATFSNYGATIEIAAPGVNIYSTYKGGGYATMSGTSMASPHTAGAAAQLLASNPTFTPADVRAVLPALATPQSPVAPTPDSTGRLRGGFSGDRESYAEPLLDAAGL
ncbi:MAG: S8 family serine peptidase [Verrucomicrobia bacterium]|nr:S8 family serine peptidase [Verrucomicrobiota bacterium]